MDRDWSVREVTAYRINDRGIEGFVRGAQRYLRYRDRVEGLSVYDLGGGWECHKTSNARNNITFRRVHVTVFAMEKR